jgi:hypothetical protein
MGLDRPSSLQSVLGFHLESNQPPLRRLRTRSRRVGRGLPPLPPRRQAGLIAGPDNKARVDLRGR